MKIYIMTDMEGVSGISGSTYVLKDGADYARGCRFLTQDVNACVKACQAAGATEITVIDGHGSGNNMLWEEMLPGVQLMQGYCRSDIRYPGVEGTDAVILLGYHAMAGTDMALLEHTFNSRSIQNLWMNGEKVGEFACDTVFAGELGLPVIMVSGCDKLCAEAKAFHPQVVTCQVKISTAQQGAIMLSPHDAHDLIYAKTLEAIEAWKAGKIHPVKVKTPVTFKEEYCERQGPWNEARLSLRCVENTAATAMEAFAKTHY